jgi:hypothetical protein
LRTNPPKRFREEKLIHHAPFFLAVKRATERATALGRCIDAAFVNFGFRRDESIQLISCGQEFIVKSANIAMLAIVH